MNNNYLQYIWFLNPLTPVLPVTGRDEPSPSFRFWRHHLWPKIGIIYIRLLQEERSFQWYPDQSDRLNEPEICTKMPRNLSENPRAKYPERTTPSYSMLKIVCLDNAFSEFYHLEAIPEERQSLQQNDKKGRKKEKKRRNSLKTYARAKMS